MTGVSCIRSFVRALWRDDRNAGPVAPEPLNDLPGRRMGQIMSSKLAQHTRTKSRHEGIEERRIHPKLDMSAIIYIYREREES
jgi:hypothetical protein